METVLLICVCVLLVLFLFAGALACGVILGALVEKRSRREDMKTGNPVSATRESAEETRRAQEEIRFQEEQHKAFQQMMNYNSDLAYGVGRSEDGPGAE